MGAGARRNARKEVSLTKTRGHSKQGSIDMLRNSLTRSPSPKKRTEYVLQKSKSRRKLETGAEAALDFDKMRKSKHLLKVTEFKEKIRQFKKKARAPAKFAAKGPGRLAKNQSEVRRAEQKPRLLKNKSFQKKVVEAGGEDPTYNLYRQHSKEDRDAKPKLKLTGKIKFGSKRELGRESDGGGEQFYKSSREVRPNGKAFNLYDTALGGEEAKQPVQLLKTRSKNTSFIKNKASAVRDPAQKNVQIRLYEGDLTRPRGAH